MIRVVSCKMGRKKTSNFKMTSIEKWQNCGPFFKGYSKAKCSKMAYFETEL